jgi:hypothetical protein
MMPRLDHCSLFVLIDTARARSGWFHTVCCRAAHKLGFRLDGGDQQRSTNHSWIMVPPPSKSWGAPFPISEKCAAHWWKQSLPATQRRKRPTPNKSQPKRKRPEWPQSTTRKGNTAHSFVLIHHHQHSHRRSLPHAQSNREGDLCDYCGIATHPQPSSMDRLWKDWMAGPVSFGQGVPSPIDWSTATTTAFVSTFSLSPRLAFLLFSSLVFPILPPQPTRRKDQQQEQ